MLASRNEELNQQAVASLQTTIHGANVSYALFDLEDFASVRTFAEGFVNNHTRVVIHSTVPRQRTRTRRDLLETKQLEEIPDLMTKMGAVDNDLVNTG